MSKITGREFLAIDGAKQIFELMHGDLCINGRMVGHGPRVHALLRLLADLVADRPDRPVTRYRLLVTVTVDAEAPPTVDDVASLIEQAISDDNGFASVQVVPIEQEEP